MAGTKKAITRLSRMMALVSFLAGADLECFGLIHPLPPAGMAIIAMPMRMTMAHPACADEVESWIAISSPNALRELRVARADGGVFRSGPCGALRRSSNENGAQEATFSARSP